MASDPMVMHVLGRAFWDPRPTQTDARAQQLAAALGYPIGWRVVRTLETVLDADDRPRRCIVDRIYSDKPGSGCDMWFHHAAAMQAAASWSPEGAEEEQDAGEGPRRRSTPYDHQGGHLLPRKPKFDKGDKVQVKYEGAWWDAKILRRKEHATGFRYQVHYPADNSRQSGVEEELIRRRAATEASPGGLSSSSSTDPHQSAVQLGLGSDWQAYAQGNFKWKLIGPDGTHYRSKKAALEAYQLELERQQHPALTSRDAVVEEGDPPWRTTGSEFLGRRVRWKTTFRASASREVTVEQVGRVLGFIHETDVDQAGQPGFVSERSGQPAKLYHVVFDDDPHHLYANHLVQSQDLEEDELIENLIDHPDEGAPPKPAKRAKREIESS